MSILDKKFDLKKNRFSKKFDFLNHMWPRANNFGVFLRFFKLLQMLFLLEFWFWPISRYLTKISIFSSKISMFIKNFFFFCQHIDFYQYKIPWKFLSKSDFCQNYRFCQNFNFFRKIEILFKNWNFWEKAKFWLKIEIFVKKSVSKIFFFKAKF